MKIINQENYVDEAEEVIKRLKNKKDKRGNAVQMVTTSKIRGLLSMTADIYNDVLNIMKDQLPQGTNERIMYLRVRFTYEAGKDTKVRDFVTEARILDILKEIRGSKENFILFSRYMEALVAFHRYYGGND